VRAKKFRSNDAGKQLTAELQMKYPDWAISSGFPTRAARLRRIPIECQ